MSTIRYYLTPIHLRYEISRQMEKKLIWFVGKLPRKLVYWCSIRLIVHATTGEYSHQIVPDLTAMDALERWGHDE